MRSVILYYILTMVLVGAIVLVALSWARLSMLHRFQGPYLLHLWSTHGLHTIDLVVLGLEILLLIALSIVILAGFTRPR